MKYTQPGVERVNVIGRMLATQSQCEASGGQWFGNGICKRLIPDGDIQP